MSHKDNDCLADDLAYKLEQLRQKYGAETFDKVVEGI